MAVESSEIQRGEYLPRVADGLLTQALQSSGAVQIKGPKWCGKTATAERQSASQVFMQDPDRSATLLALADTKPSLILRGEEPRLIDEWQMAPQLWDAVRFAIDRGRGRGRFILTGSATPQQEPAHSGVGRIARLTMRTMSLLNHRNRRALFRWESCSMATMMFRVSPISILKTPRLRYAAVAGLKQ